MSNSSAFYRWFCLAAAVISIALFQSSVLALPAWDGGEIVPEEWHALGPFHTGSRESGTDPLFYFDGKRLKTPPDFRRTYPSIFGHGGRVGWTQFKTGEGGAVEVAFTNPPESDWEMREDEWGRAGVALRGVAYTEVTMPFACRALVSAQSVGGFQINGRDYMGDPYGHNRWVSPVVLDSGVNRILAGISGWAGARTFRFKILPCPDAPAGIIEQDILMPDILQSQPLDSWAGVPVVNYMDDWMRGLTVAVGGTEGIEETSVAVPDLPPLGVLKVPVPVRTETKFAGRHFRVSEIEIPLVLSGDGFSSSHVAKLRVRDRDETFRVTFISRIDGGVQKFSVRPPSAFDDSKRYSMILSLHGAGVDSDGQVGAYGSYDWTYIVAPTNRRPYGFDWQDWGRLDALEVLDFALQTLPVDEDKVTLSGHSMGGHGTWHVGSTHPDKFAAMIPIAGWSSFQLYTPYTLRQSEIFSPPDVCRILDMCNAPDRTELIIENLVNVPLLAVHGTIDDNVPATHPRLLTGALERMGYPAKLIEQPEAGHWWDFNLERPGTDAVDAEEIMTFAYGKKRVADPAEVAFVGYDLANENTQNWASVLSQERLYGRTSVYGKLAGSDASLRTANVSALLLNLPSALWGETVRINIDGSFIPVGVKKTGVYLMKTGEGWMAGDTPPLLPDKFSGVSGPIKRAYFSPFILVDASDGQEPAAMECIVNESARWWYRANGYCGVKRFADLTEEDKRNFNLVFFGTAKMLPRELASALPVTLGASGASIGGRQIDGGDLFAKFVFPSPYNPDKLMLVNIAHNQAGLKAAERLTALYSGSSLPDFVIASESGVARYGLAGARALGFFDAGWKFDESLSYVAPERK